MNFIDKYNAIIGFIEEHLGMKTDEIVQELSNTLKVSKRTLGESFQFITGLSINEYVRNRRVVNGMKYKLQTGCSLDMVAEEFGFPDQPTFSRACKEAIKMSPSQVSNEELEKMPPLWLDELADTETSVGMLPQRKAGRMNAFGTTREQFAEIKRFIEMNRFCLLSDEYLELAYQIKVAYNLEMKEAFDFVKHISWKIEGELNKDVLKKCWECAFLHFEHGVHEYIALEKIEDMHLAGVKDITKIDESFLKVYFGRYVAWHHLTWDVVGSILTLMQHRGVPFEKFGDVVDKAVVIFHGDILAAVTFPLSVAEAFLYIEEDEEVVNNAWVDVRKGIVNSKLKELSEDNRWVEWYATSCVMKEEGK